MTEKNADPPRTQTASRFPSPRPPKAFEQLYRELERIVVSRNISESNVSDELTSLRMQVDSLTAAVERSEAERHDLEQRLEKASAHEAFFRRTLEWYAEGPFGQLATEALAQSPSEAAVRIKAAHELFFAPLQNFYSASRIGRAVRIVFEHERNAKRFYESISYFLPTRRYYGTPH